MTSRTEPNAGRPKLTRRAAMVTASVGVLMLGLAGTGLPSAPSARSAPPVAPASRTDWPVRPASADGAIVANGALAASEVALVAALVPGRIEKIHVEVGAAVQRGQPLASLAASFFDLAVKRARTDVLAAHRTVDRARSRAAWTAAELARVTELLDDDFASRADYDVAEATLTAARAEEALARSALAQAQVLLEQAEMNLRQATIVAPVSGVVTARTADVGRMLSASVLDPPLFVIAHDLRRLRLHTSLAESDVPGVRPGSPVAFTVNAYPGRTFEGTVRRVGDEPTKMDGIVTYVAVIDVENPEGRLKPGMTARVSFRPLPDEARVGVPLGSLRL